MSTHNNYAKNQSLNNQIYIALQKNKLEETIKKLGVPILDSKLICRYPWRSIKEIRAGEKILFKFRILMSIMLSLPAGLSYLLYQQLLIITKPRVKKISKNHIFISSIIHEGEFHKEMNERNFFWGSIKEFENNTNTSNCYILIPFKKIKINTLKLAGIHEVVDLRSCRAHFFGIRHFSILIISNLFYSIKLIQLLCRSKEKVRVAGLILEDHKQVLGKDLSATIYTKLLVSDLCRLISNQKVFYTCEGQSWEISLLQKIGTDIKVYAVVHVPMKIADSLISVYGSLDKLKKPLKLSFLSPGRLSSNLLFGLIDKKYPIIEVEAQRFIKKEKVQIKLLKKKTVNAISVFLEVDSNCNEELLGIIIGCFTQIPAEHVFIYPHPSIKNIIHKTKFPSFMSLPINYIPTQINLFSPSTSAFIDEIFLGSTIAIYQPVLGYSPLGFSSMEFYFDNEKALLDLISRRPVLRKTHIKPIVNLNVNLELWKKLLSK